MAQNNTCALDPRKRDELVRTVTFLSDFAESQLFNVAVRVESINRIFGTSVLIFKCIAPIDITCEVISMGWAGDGGG